MRPNDMRISCGRSCQRPHKPTFLTALEGPAARAEFCARPACRLHARVRQLPDQISCQSVNWVESCVARRNCRNDGARNVSRANGTRA